MLKWITYEHPTVVQVWHFIMHLRWHYQLFILSGGYLLGGFISETMNWQMFLLQFANIHLLLFGGATAYNSYWDKDSGPIGGLKHPPRMKPWMWSASLTLQAAGLLLALAEGVLFVLIFILSMFLFWVYSTPTARWKGRPIKSLIAIGISTGTNSLLLGYLAAGNTSLSDIAFFAAVGVALLMLSLYPVSQLYQMQEDAKRGDVTFAIQYGFSSVYRFFKISFVGGLILIAIAVLQIHFWLAHAFMLVGLVIGSWTLHQLKKISHSKEDYHKVMRIKYGTSFIFVFFLIAALLLKHTSTGMALGAGALLQ